MSIATYADEFCRLPGVPRLILWSTRLHWRYFPNLRGKWLLHELSMKVCEKGLAQPKAHFQDTLTVPADYTDLIQREIFLHGVYEPETTSELRELVKPGCTVIDVGANIGYYTLVLAKAVGDTGTVHAFEPVPRLRETLNSNIEANHFRNVTVEPLACWSSCGETEIYEAPSGNSGKSSLFHQNAKGARSHKVQVTTIDTYAATKALTKVDLIKIDVEGAELDVLEGCWETIAKWRPVLIVEVVPHFLEERGSSLKEFLELLDSRGYECRVRDARPTATDWEYCNLIATPRTRP
jgi:FkbM family methyltransferase